jgi:hypothetical protein
MRNLMRKSNAAPVVSGNEAAPAPETHPHRQSHTDAIRKAREMRQNLTEKQIDNILADSFPCSDPPGWF